MFDKLFHKKVPAPQPDNLWHLFHHLWTKAVGTSDYNKKEWQEMERNLLLLAGETNLRHTPIRDVSKK